MQLVQSMGVIVAFRSERPLPWRGGGVASLARLSEEFYGYQFPEDLATYISDFAPQSAMELEGQGNSTSLYGVAGASSLGSRQNGYSFDASMGRAIDEWLPAWFMLGDQGADPIIVDPSEPDAGVLTAFHGEGEWDFFPIADTLGQFLICSTAVDLAMAKWGVQYRSEGALPAKARTWLDTILVQWAGEYYELWMPEDD